jgi:hypothetical protein
MNTPMASVENQMILTILLSNPRLTGRWLFDSNDTIIQGDFPSMAIISILVPDSQELIGKLIGLCLLIPLVGDLVI